MELRKHHCWRWAAALAVILVGCADTDQADTDADERPQTSECQTDRECGVGISCVARRCVRDLEETDMDASVTDRSDTGSTDGRDEQCLRPSDCEDGYMCLNNECVVDEDSGTADAIATDSSSDSTGDDPSESDSGACEGRDNGQLGDSCTGSSDCCNGLCLGNTEVGRGICTERCVTYDDCNPVGLPGEYHCMAGVDGSLCVASDYGNVCENATNCVGGRCIKGWGTSSCTFECTSGSQCPAGSGCGTVTIIYSDESTEDVVVCAPVGTNCTVDDLGFTDCVSGMCITDGVDDPTGFCSLWCNQADSTACPAGFRCAVVEDGVPAVCVP